ncbi:MAG: hypothetical protein Kow0090_11860 [Myxococcota bacterium]
MNRIYEFIVEYPKTIIALTLIFVALFVTRLPKLEIDAGVKSMLPSDLPAIKKLDKIEEIFGGSEILLVIIEAGDVLRKETLERQKKISKALQRLKEVEKVMSPFTAKDIRSEGGMMIVDPAIKNIPKNDKEREELRKRIKDNDLVYDNIISKDFKASAVIATMKADFADDKLIADIEKVIAENPGDERIYIAGLPYIRENVSKDIRGDMQKFLPGGIVIMLLFLFIAFRQLRGVILPTLVVIMAIIFSMGLLVIVGWKVMMITVLLPVLLIAVANDYSIHIIAYYQHENLSDRKELTSRNIALNSLKSLGPPTIVAGVTTFAGFLSLVSHVAVPAKQLGILAASGVFFAIVASLTFVPALLAILPKAKPVFDEGGEAKNFLDKVLQFTARFVAKRPKAVIAVTLTFTLIISTGSYFVAVDTNPVNYYTEDAPVFSATNIANKHFGGSTAINIIAEGDIKEPAVLNYIENFAAELEKHKGVGKTFSIADVVKRMNKIMNDNDPTFDKIPDSKDAVAQYFLLYSMSGDPDDFDKLVDFPYRHAQLTARLNDTSTNAMREVVLFAEEWVKKHPDSPFTVVGGFADIFSTLVPLIVNGQLLSILISIFVIIISTTILFRSLVAGLLSAIPISLAMMLLFGLMGFAKIELNMATVMLASIMIGAGVDYTIHFFWRYRGARLEGYDYNEAVFRTLTTSGRGVIFNALSVVIGFVVLLFSAFLPVKFFGFLVTVSILSCLVGALVFIPALCITLKPKFLEPKKITIANSRRKQQ